MQFVSISSLQRTTKPMMENEIVCVLKNNEPVFYTISPERMEKLINAEKLMQKVVSEKIEEVAESCSIKNI